MAYLAGQPSGRLCGAREIARQEQIPHPFLWKVLQALRHRGLLRSTRGSGGGYALARSPSRIRLIEIVEALEDISEMSRCVLRKGVCPYHPACPLHHVLNPLREHFLDVLENTTLEQVRVVTDLLDNTRSSSSARVE